MEADGDLSYNDLRGKIIEEQDKMDKELDGLCNKIHHGS